MKYKIKLTFKNKEEHIYSEETMYRSEDYAKEFNELCETNNYNELKVFMQLEIESLESDNGELIKMEITKGDK